MTHVNNNECALCVRRKQVFRNKTGQLFSQQVVKHGTCEVILYLVQSGHTPLYLFDFEHEKWFGNSGAHNNYVAVRGQRFATTISKHAKLVMPGARANITWLHQHEFQIYAASGPAALVAYKLLTAA